MKSRIAESLAFVLLAACAGGDDDVGGGWQSRCDVKADCDEGLECLGALCTIPCANGDTQCTAVSATSFCAEQGFCVLSCNPTGSTCPAGLRCTQAAAQRGTCRPEL